jgi:hypothetical protein
VPYYSTYSSHHHLDPSLPVALSMSAARRDHRLLV